jgi:hypothetical protein
MIRRRALAVIGMTLALVGAPIVVHNADASDDWHKFCLDRKPTQNEWDALPFIMAFRDLPAHCLEDGLKTRISWDNVRESVPLDVSNVALDVEEPNNDIRFELLPTIQLNPIVRDLYCHRMSADWAKFQTLCPLPSIYSPPTVGLALLGWGPRILLESGLPYDLTLSGAVAEIRTQNRRLFTKSITFDGLSASLIDLNHLVIVGDLVLNKALIKNLDLDDTIVVGKIILSDSSTELSIHGFGGSTFNLKGLVVHGGVHLSGSSKLGGCDVTFGDGMHSINGSLILQKC